MRAVQFSHTGSLDHLHWAELPMPEPGPGEALVQVRATGLNPSDLKNVLGRFAYTRLPRVPGRDFAGIVCQGTQALLGQAVWGGSGKGFGFTRDGCHAEYVCVPATALARLPACLSFAQAASCGVPYLTAWDALERSQVQAHTRLLILGAGAVAQAAADLARARGAEVLLAARRPQAVAELQARQLRAFALDEALTERVAAAFDGQLAEVVIDSTGFCLAQAVAALAPFGRIAVMAAPADGRVDTPILDLYRRGGSIVGINSLLYDLDACARMLERMGELFAAGRLPLPGGFEQRPFDETLAAYRALEQGQARKIVLCMD